jgi:hypothetical protein
MAKVAQKDAIISNELKINELAGATDGQSR